MHRRTRPGIKASTSTSALSINHIRTTWYHYDIASPNPFRIACGPPRTSNPLLLPAPIGGAVHYGFQVTAPSTFIHFALRVIVSSQHLVLGVGVSVSFSGGWRLGSSCLRKKTSDSVLLPVDSHFTRCTGPASFRTTPFMAHGRK